MIAVIGSGPTAAAAATALVERGRAVTVLDAGLDLEPDRAALKHRLASSEPSGWKPADVALIRRTSPPSRARVPRKLSFGSDFAWRQPREWPALQQDRAAAAVSFAKGGFSRVWGAAVLPVRDLEISDWPVHAPDLAPHYRRVLAVTGHSAAPDRLDTLFPGYHEPSSSLQTTRQTSAFLDDLEHNAEALRSAGLEFGTARLAVRTTAAGSNGCRDCGLCLYGCPYDALFNSATVLEQLARAGRLEYLPGIWVEKLVESGGRVAITARRAGGERTRFLADRVFVAAGTFGTARIMLESLAAFDRPVPVLHSDHFTIPFLRFDGTVAPGSDPMHTLAQLFMELESVPGSRHSVHLQFYGYNDLYLKIIADRCRWLLPLLRRPLEEFVSRLFVIFGYLHSDCSSRLEIALTGDNSRRLCLLGHPSRRAHAIMADTSRRLARLRRRLRGFPLPGLACLDLPGGGFHSGGIFPMRDRPGPSETDRWGRPATLERVHIVDASVLPSLPATTITLTAMANAHRIAAGCPL
jgi:choline dehydrogenase-like flavoprotein